MRAKSAETWRPQPSQAGYSAAARRRYAARGKQMKREYEANAREYEANARKWAAAKGTPPKEEAFTITDTGCWEWNGYINELGYGYVWGMSAHRLIYSHYKQSIPPGMVLLHDCDNRRCVNPDHLTPNTQRANIADMYAKGRARPWGKDQKLTPAQRHEIKARYQDGETAQSLADAYDISAGYVQAISGRRRPAAARVSLTEEQARSVARRYHEGESGVALAAEFGVSRPRVNQLHDQYYAADDPRTPTRTDEGAPVYDEQRALSLRKSGWTHQMIADDLGCAKSTVGRLLDRAKRDHDDS